MSPRRSSFLTSFWKQASSIRKIWMKFMNLWISQFQNLFSWTSADWKYLYLLQILLFLIFSSLSEPVSKKWKSDAKLDDISGTKVMAMTNGLVPCNKHLCDLVFQVKPHVRQLVEDSNVVSWILFLCTRRIFIFYAKQQRGFIICDIIHGSD